MPFSLARDLTPSSRHFGMLPDDFQLDTVDGVRSSAVATSTVPPNASMICAALFMNVAVTIFVI